MEKSSRLANIAVVTAIALTACSGVDVDPTAIQPGTPETSAEPSTTALDPNATQTTSGRNATDTSGGHLDVEQDLVYLAEILEPLIELDQETAALIESDSWAMAEAFDITQEKARLRLLFELVFIQLAQALRDDDSVSEQFADSAIGPPEGPIIGHIHFVGAVPDEARRLVASSGVGGLVALHGNAKYTIEETELLTRDIAEAMLDLGYANSTWYDSELEVFVVTLRINNDSPKLTDEEILTHLAESIREPGATGSTLIRRVDSG